MTQMRISVRLACIVIALYIPLAGVSQSVAPSAASLAAPSPPPRALPEMPVDATEPLEGRLFFSAQQRQRMDQARKRGFVSGDDSQQVETPTSVLNGFVKRSDGNTVVWVDGDVRWNAKTASTSSLLPTDVGGPASYLKSTTFEAPTPVAKNTARSKKPVKPRAKRTTKPRLLP